MQGSAHFGPAWDALPEAEVRPLIDLWAEIIECDEDLTTRTQLVLDSITNHYALGSAWQSIDDPAQFRRLEVLEMIIRRATQGGDNP